MKLLRGPDGLYRRRFDHRPRDPATGRLLHPVRAALDPDDHRDDARRITFAPRVVVQALRGEEPDCADCLWCGEPWATVEAPLCWRCQLVETADRHLRERRPRSARATLDRVRRYTATRAAGREGPPRGSRW